MTTSWWNDFRNRDAGRTTYQTMFGEATVLSASANDGSPVRVLCVEGVLESATYLDERRMESPCAYQRAFDRMFEVTPKLAIQHVLMIGGAGFSYPKRLLTDRTSVSMDVVEIDPAIVEIARKHFFLDELEQRLAHAGESDRLNVFVQDGERFLSQRAMQKSIPRYDALVLDVFVGRNIPEFFTSDEGIGLQRENLSEGGLLLVNCVVDFAGDDMYRIGRYVERLRSRFAHVHAFEVADEDFGGAENFLLIATDGDYPFTGTVGYFD